MLDDKWAFAEWLALDADGPQGLRHWPLDAADAVYPLLLKCRHSWQDALESPRGWVCRDAGELAGRRARLPAAGLRPDWFFLQQWMGDAPMRLLSVGGFFDADDAARNLACVTDRLASYGDGPSSSAVLATVDDEWGLVDAAASVLRRLQHRGPYEMEFIVDAEAPPRVLELNPRFWMQHGIFMAFGNGLVKRYLGLDRAADRDATPPQAAVLWVDGVWLLRRLFRLDFGPIGLLWRKRYGDASPRSRLSVAAGGSGRRAVAVARRCTMSDAVLTLRAPAHRAAELEWVAEQLLGRFLGVPWRLQLHDSPSSNCTLPAALSVARSVPGAGGRALARARHMPALPLAHWLLPNATLRESHRRRSCRCCSAVATSSAA